MANSLDTIYNAPQSTTHTFQHSITVDPNNPKQSHLVALQTLVPQLQDQINVFLTERMDEDKKAAEAQGQSVSEKEAKEEENYGEEVVEDDA